MAEFMDLNVDCQHLIFDEMPFANLLTLADTNKILRSVITDAIRRRLAKKYVTFRNPYFAAGTKYNSFVSEFDDRIEVRNLVSVSRFLQTFGHFITDLRIFHNNRLSEFQSRKILHLVNFHCTDTLKRFHLSNNNYDVFDEFKKPFKRVESVLFSSRFPSLSNSNFSFSELFPLMNELLLDVLETENSDWLDEKHSNLERFTADIWSSPRTMWRFNEMSIKRMLANNLQIRYMALSFVKPTLLQFIADQLMHLEHLELEMYEESFLESFHFHFEQLKKLSVCKSSHTLPANITFGQHLVEFIADSYPTGCSRWFQLVKHQKSLKRLKIDRRLRNFEILELANARVGLIELDFECDEDVQIDSLIKLIEHSEQLMKSNVFIEVSDLRQSVVDSFERQFNNNWIISQNKSNIYLERKIRP